MQSSGRCFWNVGRKSGRSKRISAWNRQETREKPWNMPQENVEKCRIPGASRRNEREDRDGRRKGDEGREQKKEKKNTMMMMTTTTTATATTMFMTMTTEPMM